MASIPPRPRGHYFERNRIVQLELVHIVREAPQRAPHISQLKSQAATFAQVRARALRVSGLLMTRSPATAGRPLASSGCPSEQPTGNRVPQQV
jgi:hypothetical protein